MGRKQNQVVRNCFTTVPDTDQMQCNICKSLMTGNYITNMVRHLKTKHEEQWRELDFNAEVPEKKVKITMHIGKDEVKKACVDLVTTEKVPLALLDSEAFVVLTEQIFKGLSMPPINSRNVMEIISEEFYKKKELIQASLKNKIISLKIDAATRANRSILGVNAQYYSGKKLNIVTLAMIQLENRHTAANLCKEIEGVLSDFTITKKQIYCVTSDNGRNMVKAVDALNKEDVASEDPDDSNTEKVMSEVNIFDIKSIRCAAHTLQLAVKDFITDTQLSEVLGKARALSKILRCPTNRFLLSSQSLLNAEVDTPTRWSSTFRMLEKLCKLQSFCDIHIPKQNMSQEEWEEVHLLVSVLQPVHVATKKLQAEQLYFSDFYKLWLEMKLEIQAMSSSASKTLVACLENREKGLLQNEVMVSALYLDPRLRRILLPNPIQLMMARNHLKRLMRQIFDVSEKKSNAPAPTQVVTQSSDCSIFSQEEGTCTLLSNYLNTFEVGSCDEEEDDEELNSALNQIVDYNPKPVNISVNLMDYWEDKKYVYPHMYKLATLCQSVPATQVSVERAFSALKLVLTDLRTNLSAENLQKILFVKLNQ